MRPPPEGAAKVDAGGRSPGSRVNASLRPSRSERLQWQVEGRSPLTVAGAAAELGVSPHRVPFCVPPHAGTVDAEDYSRLPALRKGGGDDTLTKAALPALSASHIDGLSDERNRERGKGDLPKSAAAPATVSGEPEPNSHWEGPPGRRRRLRPASQETYRRCRSLAGRGASERLVRWRTVRVPARPPSCTLEVASEGVQERRSG